MTYIDSFYLALFVISATPFSKYVLRHSPLNVIEIYDICYWLFVTNALLANGDCAFSTKAAVQTELSYNNKKNENNA